MDNYGLIIRTLRQQKGLSLQNASRLINRSMGWLSSIENGSGDCRLTPAEFDRLVKLFDGESQRAMFRTWVANHANTQRKRKTYDGAVLKHMRQSKGLSLVDAATRTGLSFAYISKLERGIKDVDLPLRQKFLMAYGYSPSSWKNWASDPVRSKAVPIRYKLANILNELSEDQLLRVFEFCEDLTKDVENVESIVQKPTWRMK